MDITHQLELIHLKCNKCFGHLDKVYDMETFNGFRYKFNEHLKCSDCGKIFKGYRYEIDEDGNIINFKLIEYSEEFYN